MIERRHPGYFDMPEEAVWERAQTVSLVAVDVDGVLTDGSVYLGAEGEMLKSFHIHDGKGLRLLSDAGLAVAWISARSSPALEYRARELGIVDLIQGCPDKGAALAELCRHKGLAPDRAAFVGDDLVDLGAMARAGLAVAVADAHPAVRARAHWVTARPGGRGAVREVCELVLAAHGLLDDLIEGHDR